MNPMTLWSQWLRAGQMMAETLEASQAVIARRGDTIADAAKDPLSADHRELARMVCEKGSAFAAAGASLTRDWAGMHGDLMAQGEAMARMWMRGSPPSMAALGAIADRGARLNQRALASGTRALRPIHATVTANRKRLAKS